MFRRIFESFQVFWVVVCSQAESDTLDKGRVAIEIVQLVKMFKTAM